MNAWGPWSFGRLGQKQTMVGCSYMLRTRLLMSFQQCPRESELSLCRRGGFDHGEVMGSDFSHRSLVTSRLRFQPLFGFVGRTHQIRTNRQTQLFRSLLNFAVMGQKQKCRPLFTKLHCQTSAEAPLNLGVKNTWRTGCPSPCLNKYI